MLWLMLGISLGLWEDSFRPRFGPRVHVEVKNPYNNGAFRLWLVLDQC